MSKVYDIVKDTIIKKLQTAIENNENFTWIKPWNGNRFPMNYISKKYYTGVNSVTLPYGGYYLTFNQVKKLNGKVKKGSKSYPVFFWKFPDDSEENKDDDEVTKKAPIFRFYNVFHQSDIENIDFDNVEEKSICIDNNIKEFIQNYSNICKINFRTGIGRAFYSPSNDEINIPTVKEFNNINMFYSTLFHEMIHSTGHCTRLNRLKNDKFGSENYSKEELVAEIGSCLLKANFNIQDEETDTMSIAYLKGWCNYLKGSKGTEIVSALQSAHKAYNYLISES